MREFKLATMTFMIENSVPLLNVFRTKTDWPFSLEELGAFDSRTLGYAVYQLLNSRGLSYLSNYEMHDTYHALLNYDTTVMHELYLQAFMLGNNNATFPGKVLLIFGLVFFPLSLFRFKEEFQKGRTAKPLRNCDVCIFLPKRLSALRKDLCIKS